MKTSIFVSMVLFLTIQQIKASPRKRGKGGGNGGSETGFGSNSGYSGGGWHNPSGGSVSATGVGGNSGYSGGGLKNPSGGASGATGLGSNSGYSGGGWNNPSSGSMSGTGVGGNSGHFVGGWKSPSGGHASGTGLGGSGGNPSGSWKNPSHNTNDKSSDFAGKKKGFLSKNWKTAAAFGAGAYVGHQLSQGISKLFEPNLFFYNGHQYDFNTWDRYARKDGWVCRNDTDCSWIDPHLVCDKREFNLNEIRADWPWKAALKGRCACKDNLLFDTTNGTCYNSGSGWWITIIVAIAVIGGFVACCCCIWRFKK
jgi:hypothetical protein